MKRIVSTVEVNEGVANVMDDYKMIKLRTLATAEAKEDNEDGEVIDPLEIQLRMLGIMNRKG